MASLKYLWSNRAIFSITSVKFYRAWGKRFFSISELIKRNRCRMKLVRQGATIHESAEIGYVTAEGKKNQLSVGPFSSLGRIYIALHEPVIIGERVCINDGVQILTASHDVSDPSWKPIKAKVVIEDYVWIATGAIILPGVRLGRGAVVGAGAVVSKPVLPGEIVVGNPARPIQKSRCLDLHYNPCSFLAANSAWLIG